MIKLLAFVGRSTVLLTGAILALFTPHSAWCSPGTRTLHAQFSPDGREVVTVRVDGMVQRWSAEGFAAPEGFMVAAVGERVTSAAISADGTRLIVGTSAVGRTALSQPSSTNVRLWDLRAGVALRTLITARGMLSVVLAPDGATAATISADGTIQRWATQDGALLDTAVLGEGAWELLGFAQGTRRLMMLDAEGMLNVRDDQGDDQGIDALRTFGSVRVSSGGVRLLADGGRLLASHGDGVVRLWNLQTGVLIYTLRGHRTAISGLAVSPDGRMIATAGWDAITRLWDAQSGTLIHEFIGHFQAVSSLAYSPDGKRLLIASSYDDLIKQWYVPEGSLAQRVRSYDVALAQGPVTGMMYAPNGKTLLYLAHDPQRSRDIPVLREADTLRLHRLLCPRPISEVWSWLGVGVVVGVMGTANGRWGQWRRQRRAPHSTASAPSVLRG